MPLGIQAVAERSKPPVATGIRSASTEGSWEVASMGNQSAEPSRGAGPCRRSTAAPTVDRLRARLERNSRAGSPATHSRPSSHGPSWVFRAARWSTPATSRPAMMTKNSARPRHPSALPSIRSADISGRQIHPRPDPNLKPAVGKPSEAAVASSKR